MNIQKIEQHITVRNEAFITKADQLKPSLFTEKVTPVSLVNVLKKETAIHGWSMEHAVPVSQLSKQPLGKKDSFILDFGDHQVGYLAFDIRPAGSPPDAPLKLKLTIGEMPVEMAEPFDSYDGWLSSSWLQEETLFVDVLPGRVELPRRYSFRYVKVEVLETSPKYKVVFDKIECLAVTSADYEKVEPLAHPDFLLQKIDEVSIKTLADCMQDVFEDGPKRDRRLWLGDLRLQALANYQTFQANDLVKRCLYLFAGVPNNKGQITANVFVKPTLIADDTFLFDYSLFFVSTLSDYYEATSDMDTLKDLWPTALRQVNLALERLDERYLVTDLDNWWSFIDWQESLNKQAPSQAVLIYVLKQAVHLAAVLQAPEHAALMSTVAKVVEAAKQFLWNEEKQFFVSGAEQQISWASQVWMVLADILPEEENRALLNRLLTADKAVGMATPYMYHHYVEALLLVGEREKAIEQMKEYWGGMIKDGADTFWELYDPKDKHFSPYGSHLINSYCHAWSCTPTYLIRKYHL